MLRLLDLFQAAVAFQRFRNRCCPTRVWALPMFLAPLVPGGPVECCVYIVVFGEATRIAGLQCTQKERSRDIVRPKRMEIVRGRKKSVGNNLKAWLTRSLAPCSLGAHGWHRPSSAIDLHTILMRQQQQQQQQQQTPVPVGLSLSSGLVRA